MTSDAIIILGMHRSGTSALTGVLSMLGANPGPSLLPAVKDVNPKGFWEHAEIVATHDALLEALGSSWDDERPLPNNWWASLDIAVFRERLTEIILRDFSHSPLWILKDPRLCKLLPLWLDILRDSGASPRFVICLRDPVEVARSLLERDGIPEAQAALLWLECHLESERMTRAYPRVFLTYEQLLTDWKTTCMRIATTLSLTLHIDETATWNIEKFLDPALRHHRTTIAVVSGDNSLPQLAANTYALLTRVGENPLPADIPHIAERTEEIARMISPWSDQVRYLKQINGNMKAQIVHLETEVARIKATSSWRITKPLRLLSFLWRKVHVACRTLH